MKLKKEKIAGQKKEENLIYKFILFFAFILFFSNITLAQDSIPVAKDLSEENDLMFQQFFFKALSQKSIGNHQKAIENLESCNQILQNNSAVFFEFSKNYEALNNLLLAKEYINRALQQEPNNIWMQKHLVEILVKERNFNEAIETQKKVVALKPKERPFLVRLYLQNNDTENAMNLIQVLEKENILPQNLLKFKETYQKRNDKVEKEEGVVLNLENIIEKFKTDKSYTLLQEILEKSQKNTSQLLQFSTEGIALFPAQPFVYLMNAKALIANKEYSKAIETLKNGIDFVIEDNMEADFYKEMSLAYKGLGNINEEQKYLEKYKKLKS